MYVSVYNLDLTQIGYEYYIKFLDIGQVIKTCCSKTSQIVPFPHSGELSHGENHMWRRQSKFWHLVHRRHILTHSDQNLIWHWKLVRASGIFAAQLCVCCTLMCSTILHLQSGEASCVWAELSTFTGKCWEICPTPTLNTWLKWSKVQLNHSFGSQQMPSNWFQSPPGTTTVHSK